jgi:hypothetical protein
MHQEKQFALVVHIFFKSIKNHHLLFKNMEEDKEKSIWNLKKLELNNE